MRQRGADADAARCTGDDDSHGAECIVAALACARRILRGDVPTIARLGPYRFFFYSGDRGEPLHVHVEREDMLAKFWLAGPSLAESRGFPAHELRTLTRIVVKHREKFAEAWDEHFRS